MRRKNEKEMNGRTRVDDQAALKAPRGIARVGVTSGRARNEAPFFGSRSGSGVLPSGPSPPWPAPSGRLLAPLPIRGSGASEILRLDARSNPCVATRRAALIPLPMASRWTTLLRVPTPRPPERRFLGARTLALLHLPAACPACF